MSHSGVRKETERDRLMERGREGGCRHIGRKKSTHPNWPSGYESLKNENAVIILIRYKVFFFYIYNLCM